MSKLQKFLMQLLPFIVMGVFLVICIVAIIFFSYLLLIGGLIGLILFGIAYIRSRFFSKKEIDIYRKPQKKGDTYDHKP